MIDQLFSTETIGTNLAYVGRLPARPYAGIPSPPVPHRRLRYHFLVSDEADKVIESVEIDIAPSCKSRSRAC